MSNRRVDVIYFFAFAVVMVIGYAISQAPEEESHVASFGMPEFSFPAIEFELPIEFSYKFVKFKRPDAPQLALTENTESVRKELRSSLLASSTLAIVEAVEAVETVGAVGTDDTETLEAHLASVVDHAD